MCRVLGWDLSSMSCVCAGCLPIDGSDRHHAIGASCSFYQWAEQLQTQGWLLLRPIEKSTGNLFTNFLNKLYDPAEKEHLHYILETVLPILGTVVRLSLNTIH